MFVKVIMRTLTLSYGEVWEVEEVEEAIVMRESCLVGAGERVCDVVE